MTRKEQKEARKVQIIQATLDLFVERGYYGTKTSQISRRAGISEGLLFHYFPTKEILLEELVNIGLEGMRMPMQVRAENGLDFFYQFTKLLFLQTEKNPFIAKMFVFMDMWRGRKIYRRNFVGWPLRSILLHFARTGWKQDRKMEAFGKETSCRCQICTGVRYTESWNSVRCIRKFPCRNRGG